MPLPESPGRSELHRRTIEFRGFRRDDGDFEIDAHLVDRKTYPMQPPGADHVVPADAPIHDLWLRVKVTPELEVLEVATASDTTPYAQCLGGGAALQALVGARIAAGWTKRVKDAVGGARSCTHLMELLLTVGTAAFQTISSVRLNRPEPLDATGRPKKIDSCFAYASDSPVVLKRWPRHFTGPGD